MVKLTLEQEKKMAVDFLHLVVDGDIEAAFLRYVDMSGRQHNPYSPAGFPALMKSMLENRYQSPNKKLFIINALAEGDVAAVQTHLQMDGADVAVAYFFRFKDGRIVEMWDIGQPQPEESPNQDGMF